MEPKHLNLVYVVPLFEDPRLLSNKGLFLSDEDPGLPQKESSLKSSFAFAHMTA